MPTSWDMAIFVLTTTTTTQPITLPLAHACGVKSVFSIKWFLFSVSVTLQVGHKVSVLGHQYITKEGYNVDIHIIYLFCQSIFGIRFSWHYLLALFKMLLHHLMSSHNWPVRILNGSDNIVVSCGQNLTLKHHSMQCILLVAANILSPPPPCTLSWIQHNCEWYESWT